MNRVVAIILAAGASTRMGFTKQLLNIDGTSLIRNAVIQGLESNCCKVFVVLGYDAELVSDDVDDLDIRIVMNDNWRDGIASSICTGINALMMHEPDIDACLIMLADQPLIRPELLNNLISQMSEATQLVASKYDGTFGVPALFGRKYFDELKTLTGDTGAKNILMRHQDEIVFILNPDAMYDLDTPDDLSKFI